MSDDQYSILQCSDLRRRHAECDSYGQLVSGLSGGHWSSQYRSRNSPWRRSRSRPGLSALVTMSLSTSYLHSQLTYWVLQVRSTLYSRVDEKEIILLRFQKTNLIIFSLHQLKNHGQKTAGGDSVNPPV